MSALIRIKNELVALRWWRIETKTFGPNAPRRDEIIFGVLGPEVLVLTHPNQKSLGPDASGPKAR